MAAHRVYVSHDTVISYAHSWYIASRLWHGHGLPLRMPVLGHGDALTFPYGIVPWTAAALLRPLLGDWSTTLVLVAATVGLMAATFWAFPELARGWSAVAVLVEPAMVSSPIIGQVPFVTGAALLLVAVGAWRRGRVALAVVAAALAQATHPATVLPLAALLVVGHLPWAPRRTRLVGWYLLSAALATPAVVMTLVSPVVEEASVATKIAGFLGNLAPRCLLIVVPVAVLLLQRRGTHAFAMPALVALLVAADIAMWTPLGMEWAWRALGRQPDARMARFAASDAFRSGATYRVLRVADGKIGMYQLLRHGARLDSEFFPESIDRRSWPTTSAYRSFLRHREVDFVMLWGGYDAVFHTNEHHLLEELGRQGCEDRTWVRLALHTDDFDLYSVDPCTAVSGSPG